MRGRGKSPWICQATFLFTWVVAVSSLAQCCDSRFRGLDFACLVWVSPHHASSSNHQMHRGNHFACGAFGLQSFAVAKKNLFRAMAVAFLAIACGAPIAVEYASRTLHWSIFMSILLVLPAAMVLGTSWPDWHRIFALTRPKRDVEFLICIPAHGAAIGAWLGAWVMPLDWDRLWQDWPISCTYGAVGGYLSGLFVSSILTYFQSTFDWLKAE
ncbi:hypothetical protein O6H91_02G113400 [Diphasiastrum complanatum]|uniref:Uncharacterized protein n=1 Tax=Diphasiastrum complanatum TaxID=34168 RepID=A0ACC2EJM5_DIPCM|nr:hypothetical protein O6H91_02G113400 [Diphasiastrum complanatum]